MKKLAELVISIAVLTIPVTGSTQTLTEAQAAQDLSCGVSYR